MSGFFYFALKEIIQDQSRLSFLDHSISCGRLSLNGRCIKLEVSGPNTLLDLAVVKHRLIWSLNSVFSHFRFLIKIL